MCILICRSCYCLHDKRHCLQVMVMSWTPGRLLHSDDVQWLLSSADGPHVWSLRALYCHLHSKGYTAWLCWTDWTGITVTSYKLQLWILNSNVTLNLCNLQSCRLYVVVWCYDLRLQTGLHRLLQRGFASLFGYKRTLHNADTEDIAIASEYSAAMLEASSLKELHFKMKGARLLSACVYDWVM